MKRKAILKITRTAEKINLNQVMDIRVDVHKDILYFFFVANGKKYSDECGNRTNIRDERLKKYPTIAGEHNDKNLRILCESTGQYQNILLRPARRVGCFTCYVKAESVARF